MTQKPTDSVLFARVKIEVDQQFPFMDGEKRERLTASYYAKVFNNVHGFTADPWQVIN